VRIQRVRATVARWATRGEPLALEVAGTSPARLVATRAALGAWWDGVLALARPWWLLPLLVPVFGQLPLRAVHGRLAAWRRELRLELCEAVDYLQLHFDTGATVPDAMDRAAAFLTGRLAAELRRVRVCAALGSPERALSELAERLTDPDADSLARRLGVAWSRRALGPDTSAGLREALRWLRTAQVDARTRALPIVYTPLVG
jgi:Flp pilus assembly protein TadB